MKVFNSSFEVILEEGTGVLMFYTKHPQYTYRFQMPISSFSVIGSFGKGVMRSIVLNREYQTDRQYHLSFNLPTQSPRSGKP